MDPAAGGIRGPPRDAATPRADAHRALVTTNAYCSVMEPVCAAGTFPGGTLETANLQLLGNDYGHGARMRYPTWHYLTAGVAGLVQLEISHHPATIIRFALWGPYADLNTAKSHCDALPGPGATLLDWWDGEIHGGTAARVGRDVLDFPSMQAGEIYVLMIYNLNRPDMGHFMAEGGPPANANQAMSLTKRSGSGPGVFAC